MNLKDIKSEAERIEIPPTCPNGCEGTLDVDDFLRINGPETSYIFARKLIEAADKDIGESTKEFGFWAL